MRRLTGFLALLWGMTLGASILQAQTVAEDVLKNAALQKIHFIDYVGPVSVYNTREQIIGIGRRLGEQRLTSQGPVGGPYYKAWRFHDAQSPLLSADVLVLEPQASVDTIRNLNWIVAGYLEKAFGYSFDDALLLADFVTRYNAVYRGNVAYFSKMYVPALAAHLTPENAGIALNYRDWPGKTRLVIPLRDTLSQGPAGQVNAEEVSNPAVTKNMTQAPALEERKKLADLKETEIVKEQKVINQKAEALAGAEAQPAAPQPSGTPLPSPSVTPSPSPSALAQEPSPAPTPSSSPAPVALTPAQVAKEKQILQKAQAANHQRDVLLQKERQSIQKADQVLQAQPPTPQVAPPPATVPFLQTVSDGLSRLDLIDIAGKRLWKASALNSIRRGEFQKFGKAWLVTAGENRGEATVRLVLMSASDLTVLAQSPQEASPSAPVVVVGTLAYAIVKSDGQWKVASYDTQLQTHQLSPVSVREDSGLEVTPQAVLVQDPSGKVLLLDPEKLTKIALSKDTP